MMSVFLIAQSAAFDAGINWGNVIAGIGLFTAVMSGLLGVFFKLQKSNISTMFQLTSQEAAGHAKLYEERLSASTRSFEQRVDAISETFHKAMDASREKDSATYERLAAVQVATNKKLEMLEKDYRKFIGGLPLTYVQRDDWIREFSKVDAKLDAIWQELTETLKSKCK